MRIINNYENKSLERVMVRSLPWHTIGQKQIDLFTDATLDHRLPTYT